MEGCEEGAGGACPGDAALQEKGLRSELPYCPHAPAPRALTGRGLTGAQHHLLSCPVHRRQAKITADTCQAIQPQGQRFTNLSKQLRTMDLRHMQTCDQCHTGSP